MKLATGSWQALVADARREWGDSRLLRMGTLGAVVLLWLYGLLALGDLAARWTADADGLRERVQVLTPMAREKHWDQRAAAASQQAAALETLLWREPALGLAEAAVQDWVRARAGSWQLPVRELRLQRESASVPELPGVLVMRVRLVTDLRLNGLLGLLAELGTAQRVVAVERMQLRFASQPALAELELRAVAQVGAVSTEGAP